MPLVVSLGTFVALILIAAWLDGLWTGAWIWWYFKVLAPWLERIREARRAIP